MSGKGKWRHYRLSKTVKIYARMYRNLKGVLGKQMPEVKLLKIE